ncbi:recombinase family protein [Clostridium sp. FP2]|uniref:recombinase family protein n=1 Tax=Clostridium sp. FP2 TaxID=2724481 RepID=UPI0013E97B22|nr:recombinase family protein [Clostridium sp. FP2]MBZ9624439.1 recombinase family protein [Clostridium sp. FP2]
MQKVAIYSRKSKFTGKGDSIENQIEMCKEYISSHLGKNVEYIIYEDEGFSGSTLNRPNFLKLMQDVKLKKINVLACYRLDRISRNVADFSSTLEMLNNNNVDFISISEQFDTSSPMGKAMIYIASVFAQLERETIAERVKDNMLELAKNGKWTGGRIPLGFISKKTKYTDEMGLQREITTLTINEIEMKFVKFIYEKYLELGSLHKLECYITENDLKSRNNILFEKTSLKIILQNPVYVKANDLVIEYLKTSNWIVYGEADNIHSLLTYNKTQQSIVDGKHIKTLKSKEERLAAVSNIEGAIEPDLWLQVQTQFEDNKDKFPRLGKTNNALLTGKLKCGVCKEYMLIQHGRVSKITGVKAFYYMCSLKRKSHKKCCDNSNANAADLESLVLLSLKNLGSTKKVFIDGLMAKYNLDLKNNEKTDEKLALNKLLSEKKKQISGLISELSKEEDEYMKGLIRIEINPLKNDCIKIESKLIASENKIKKEKVDKINLQLIENVLSECGMIDTLPRERQKQIIDILIESIYWYGNDKNNGEIKIKFIGTDGEDNEELELYESMLQFNTPSMTCI